MTATLRSLPVLMLAAAVWLFAVPAAAQYPGGGPGKQPSQPGGASTGTSQLQFPGQPGGGYPKPAGPGGPPGGGYPRPGGPPSGMPYGPGGPANAPGVAAPAVAPLPDNVAEWERDHFRRARREGDPRLRAAVEYLGKRFAGVTKDDKDQEAAKLLTTLLKYADPKIFRSSSASPGASPASPYPGSGPPGGTPYSRPGGPSPGPGGPPPGYTGPSGAPPGYSGPSGPPGGYRSGPSGYSSGPPGYSGPGGYPGQPGAQVRYVPLDQATIKAIVYALAVNGSKTARQTLTEVLNGAFQSDDDRAATEGRLETLVFMPSPENEEILFRVLTNPEQIRPTPADQTQPGPYGPSQGPGYPGSPYGPARGPSGPPGYSGPSGPSAYPATPYGPARGPAGPPGYSGPSGPSGYPAAPYGPARGPTGPSGYSGSYGPSSGGYPRSGQGKMTAAEVQATAVALVDQHGSEAFRIKLADHLAKATTADDARQVLFNMLAVVHPRNVAAQAILYRGDGLDKGSKAILEGYLVKYSSAALAAFLKVPEELPGQQSSQAPRGPYGPGSMPGPGRMNMPGGIRPPSGPQPPGGLRPPPPGDDTSTTRPRDGLAMFAVQDRAGSSDAGPGGPSAPAPRGPPGFAPGRGPGMSPTVMPKTPPRGPSGMAPGMAPRGPSGPYPYPGGPTPGSSYSGTGGLTGALASVPGFTRETIPGLAAPLWAPEFTKALQARLDTLESLDADAATIVLASTIPTDAMRANLYRALKSRIADQGPQGLEAAGLAGDVLSDPGLLVIMKLLDRKEAKPAKSTVPNLSRLRDRSRSNPRGGEAGRPGGPGPRGTGPDGSPYGPGPTSQQQQPVTPVQEWNATAERLARALCERFMEAARTGKGTSAAADSRPVELPGGKTTLVSEYHLQWPEDLPDKGKLAGVPLDPMVVHYVRFRRESSVNNVIAFYRRYLTRPVEHTVASGVWIESHRKMPETGRQLSVDVLITKADAGRTDGAARGPAGPGYGPKGPGTRPGDAGGSRYGGQPNPSPEREKNLPADLIVEVLAVEINDPSGTEEPAQPAQPAAAEPDAAKEKP